MVMTVVVVVVVVRGQYEVAHESCLRPLQTSHAGLERLESSFSSWPADVAVLLVGNSVYRIFSSASTSGDQLARQEWDVSYQTISTELDLVGANYVHILSFDTHTGYSANCSRDSLTTSGIHHSLSLSSPLCGTNLKL
ncbi:hypothetical protein E2C01_077630 [Portunus trituberculatus]|uniref:Uncharacterized protein n=1 Tax=Portunus trituberculatus TaxID=210409 RepID=A0A5B7IBW3_PORTR|nr:hypothetical protein [Portunus trituberculatus]